MVQVPDHWPPDDDDASAGALAPMFPLRDVFLFPGQLLPLHIFEPRYRTMIEDGLDGPGRIIMATAAGEDGVLPVAGIGEIAQHHRLPDGRFLIWLLGMARVRIEEVASDRPYRQARYHRLEEVGATPQQSTELQAPLHEAIQERVGQALQLPATVTTGQLADILGQCLQLPATLMAQIYSEPCVPQRARMVLDAHQRFPRRKPPA